MELRWVTKPMVTHKALAVVVVLATATAAGCTSSKDSAAGGTSSTDGKDSLRVTAVSTRPEMVSGGDVVISVPAAKVDAVEVDGKAVDAKVIEGPEGETRALVSGLPDGASTISVRAAGHTGELKVTNHPVAGPVFSGERLPMATCTTQRFGLGESTPPECAAPTRVTYGYIDDKGKVKDLAPGTAPPAGAKTVTVKGATRPAVLRIERGVIDRGVYEITTLAEGATAPPEPAAWDAAHWNGRLVYRFGGGCGTTFSQGFEMLGAPDAELLAEGYAFATNTLDTFQVQCQDIISAEAAMMTKEHFAEAYGVPEITIGEGGSGGAIQQLLVAQNYPGILDAIGPSLVFPDAVSIAPGVVDCALLDDYYATPSGAELTKEQKAAVNGHLTTDTCLFWQQTFVPAIDPTTCGFGDAVSATGADRNIPGLEDGVPTPPPEQVYDPKTNPKGIRCTFQDSYPQVLARDPSTGFVKRPLDNTGVQYGLKALNAGVITPEQFVTLNEKVGGFDIDANHIASRMVADQTDIEKIYSTGRVVEGGALHDVPIMALNVYTDPGGDIHDRMRMFSLNDRLAGKDGTQAPNYVMWTRPKAPGADMVDQLAGVMSAGSTMTRLLDKWATALKADKSRDPMATRMARARPAEAVNACFDVDGKVQAEGPKVYEGSGPCTDPYPIKDDPRTAAGAPLRNDIMKCRLQPVAGAVRNGVYKVELSAEQVARLEAVFPDGVCDWSRPGVGQVPLGDSWRTFG